MIRLLKKNSVWLLAGVAILVLPLVFSSGFSISLMGLMGIMIIFALAYNMLLGQGGMLSFGHAVYYGLGGYFTIHFLQQMESGSIGYFPISLLPLFGGLVGLFFGVLIGFVSTRRAGTIFALISLGFVEMMTALTFVMITFFNGEEGIQGNRFIGPEPFGITFGPDIQVYYLIGAWCLIAMIAMYAITKTPFGRMSNAVRDNPERAQFIGYNTQRVRWLAFSLSSFFAGLAGALFALHFEHVGFEAAGLALSGDILFMTFFGGMGHFLGPIVGAILFTFLNGVLSDFSLAWHLYLGVIFVLTVMLAPTGIAGLILRHEPVWKTDYRLLGKMALPYLNALVALLITAGGIIALTEMLYFASDDYSLGTITRIYGIKVELAGFLSWLSFGIIALIGTGLCKVTFPIVTRNWNDVMDTVKERMLR
ncbi:MAG TPA: branched-chain amino acid ABC transporter permease [Desulfobacterales bacterium]|nr:branched-chain amino acid ABC transporter permease [Desulfobacterales bacterium]